MFAHIMIATDGPELAQRAVAQGLALAKALGAKATAVTVSEPMAAMWWGRRPLPSPSKSTIRPRADAARVLAGLAPRRRRPAWRAIPSTSASGFPPRASSRRPRAAKAQGCSLIVMASHGRRGTSKLLLGSEAARVLTLSEAPVLICR